MSLRQRLSVQKFEARWPAVVIWLFAWGLLGYFDGTLSLGNLALLLVLASAVAGLWLSAAFSIISSALSVLMFNWFFVEPRFTFSVNFQQDLLLLITMMGVSSVVGYLMVRLRIAANLESEHAYESDQLRVLGEELRELNNVPRQGALLHQFFEQYSCGPVILRVIEGNEEGDLLIGNPDTQDEQGLLACAKQFEAMGPGTGRHENQTTLFLPLRGRAHAFGAVAFKNMGSIKPTRFNQEFLQQVCDLFGLEIERNQTLRLAQLAQAEAKSHVLRNTLLTSISHDYRTPLANLMGAASVIHDQTDKLTKEKIADLAQTVLDEAQHFQAQVGRIKFALVLILCLPNPSSIISPMQRLRNAIQIARFVLVWFALSVGVAIASPIIKPESTALICTGTGVMKLVAVGEDADKPVSSHQLDCPLCASISAPPPAFNTSLTQPSPLAHVMQPLAAAHIASVTSPPLPSRGPPALSL